VFTSASQSLRILEHLSRPSILQLLEQLLECSLLLCCSEYDKSLRIEHQSPRRAIQVPDPSHAKGPPSTRMSKLARASSQLGKKNVASIPIKNQNLTASSRAIPRETRPLAVDNFARLQPQSENAAVCLGWHASMCVHALVRFGCPLQHRSQECPCSQTL
jgi:hypothetical protein